jgi:hypothetical protein
VGETAADGKADSHPREGRKAWRGPRECVGEGGGDVALGALAEEAKEGLPRGSDGAKGADGKVDDAEVGREGHGVGALEAVLVATRRVDDGDVGGEACAVGVVVSDVGGAGHVQRLDLDARVAACTVEAKEDDIRRVLEVRACALHKLAHRRIRAGAAVDDDPVSAEDRLADGSEGKCSGVVAGAAEADAVHALHEAARAEDANGGVGDGRGAV